MAAIRILETALYVDDMDAAEAFYERVLGLEKLSRGGDRHLFFRAGSGVLLMFNPAETEIPPGADQLAVPAHGARGPGHLCFAATAAELKAWEERLAMAGVEIESHVTWPSGGRSIYFRDPAGNSLEFAEPSIWGI